MPDWDRSKALIAMTTTPLGPDAFIPTSMMASEAISNPFNFEIHAVSQTGVVDPDKVLNLPACLALRDANGPVRYFHGIVRDIRANGIVRGKAAADVYQSYTLTLVPRLWFLRQTYDCRVYQNKTVKDILTAVFGDAKLSDVTFSVDAGTPRPYTVQFNESDYDFAMRLMEEEGWFWYFDHTDAKHTLIVTDRNATFQAIPNATLHFAANANDVGGILDWQAPDRTTAGSFALADYDPENPGTKLYNQHKTVLKATGSESRDVFHWPALTNTSGVVEARAKFQIEAAEAAVALYHGASQFGALTAGGKFTLANSPAGSDDGTYALRAVQHIVEDSSWISNSGTTSYRNRFEAFKTGQNWRQPLVTPRPRMDGIHSAIVMGPQTKGSDATGAGGTEIAAIKMQDGEEIYTDDLARVKVRFFWDHRSDASGGAAIWARVIQPWAGNGWGTQFIPRVGTEVAVAFVDADPDRPIVIGGLYNGISKPIYPKSEATKSGIRTRSSLKGDTSKFNELTFDDKSGSELIFVHAEKDLTTEVEHDEHLTVDNCRVVLVKVDETITVQGKQTITVTKDHTFEVTEGNFKSTIDQGNHDLKVTLGNITVQASAGAISMEAAQSITLKVGGNSVTIDQTGVTVKGLMISVEGSVSTDIKGLMTSLKGDAMVTIKGGITMIN